MAGLTAGVVGLLGAGLSAPAAALGGAGPQVAFTDPLVKGLTIEWYATGPTEVGTSAEMMLSLGCSSADNTPCTDVRVDIPWGPDPNLPDPALGATPIKDWSATWRADAGLIDSTTGTTSGTLRKSGTGWYFTLTNPLPAGATVNVGVSIRVGKAPHGTVFTAGAVASAGEVTPVSADPLEFSVSARMNTNFTDRPQSRFAGEPISPTFDLTVSGSPGYRDGTCLVEGTLPADLEFADLTPVNWDPSTRHWSMPCTSNGKYTLPAVKAVPGTYEGQKSFPVQISGVVVGETERVASQVYNSTLIWLPRTYPHPNSLFDKVSYSNYLLSDKTGMLGSAAKGTLAYQLAGFESKTSGRYDYAWIFKSMSTSLPVNIEVTDYFPCMDAAQSPGVYVSSTDGVCASPAFHFTGLWASNIEALTFTSLRYLHGDGSVREIDVDELNSAHSKYPLLLPMPGEVVTGIELKATRAGSSATTLELDGYWDASLVAGNNVYNTASFKLAFEDDPVGVTATMTERNVIAEVDPTAAIRWSSSGATANQGTPLNTTVYLDALWARQEIADVGQLFVAYRDVDGLFSPTWNPASTSSWVDSTGADGARIVSSTVKQNPLGPAPGVPAWIGNNRGPEPTVTSTLGQYTLEAVVGIPGVQLESCQYFDTLNGWRVEPNNVLLADGAAYGAPEGTSVCVISKEITVIGATPAVQVNKFVRGDLDDAAHGQGVMAEISTDGSGWAQYTLKVVNVGSQPLKEATLYDFLPTPGDVYLAGDTAGVSRGSTLSATLAEPPTVPAGWEVAYSTSPNACAPEISTISGCVNDWSTAVPADLGSVRALRFTHTGRIAVGALASEIGVKVTVGAYDRSHDALWNTAAIRAQIDNATYPPNAIAPVETGRVGFGKVSYGFLVQKLGADATGQGEPSVLDGARFELRADAGGAPGDLVGDGASFAPVPDAVGRWEATVPSGTYWLVEVAPPAGYVPLVEPVKVMVDALGTVTLADDVADVVVSLVHEEAGPVIQIVNYPGLVLPNTGGAEAGQILAVLAILVLGGTAAIIWRRRATAEA